jgi:hypothetical protein
MLRWSGTNIDVPVIAAGDSDTLNDPRRSIQVATQGVWRSGSPFAVGAVQQAPLCAAPAAFRRPGSRRASRPRQRLPALQLALPEPRLIQLLHNATKNLAGLRAQCT